MNKASAVVLAGVASVTLGVWAGLQWLVSTVRGLDLVVEQTGRPASYDPFLISLFLDTPIWLALVAIALGAALLVRASRRPPGKGVITAGASPPERPGVTAPAESDPDVIADWYHRAGGKEATAAACRLVATLNSTMVGSHNYAVQLIEKRLRDTEAQLDGAPPADSPETRQYAMKWTDAYCDVLGVARSLLEQLVDEDDPIAAARDQWSRAHSRMLERLAEAVGTRASGDVRADVLDRLGSATSPR